MSLSINHNLMATNSALNLGRHQNSLARSVRRLSSGLRVGTAADDAAGLAIRELMRADIATLRQGTRNAKDAISMLQTADGALQVIDEKLIRMKELATQAATGTYSEDQRLMIASEFQAMADEINRIANSTEFNGVKLLDGSLSGVHDGSGLQSLGAAKIHFGTGNDSAEDYYYVDLGRATIGGLGLGTDAVVSTVPALSDVLVNGAALTQKQSGIRSFARIPAGSTNVRIHLDDNGWNDSIELFTASGVHISGTVLGGNDWNGAGVTTVANMNSLVITATNGFNPGAAYSGGAINGTGANLSFSTSPLNTISYNGMSIQYSGDGNLNDSGINLNEYLTIDNVTEDLVLIVAGSGVFDIQGAWGNMPSMQMRVSSSDTAITIRTQTHAQEALETINGAIVTKDGIRAHIGALQNRFENTISNLQIQAENMQAAESRISDVDVATEMTEFVRSQILMQAAVAMLSQANSTSKMAMELLTA